MSVRLPDVFSAAELQLAQVAMAKASAGCTTFFAADDGPSLTCFAGAIGRRVSLCCFNQELSLLCGQAALEQAKVAGGHISDTHKCRCGAFYYWVNMTVQGRTAGYCQIRTVEALPHNGAHLVASYLRTLTSIANIRATRNQLAQERREIFASLDPHHLYGHPYFLPLIRMIGEAGRSLLHATRCLYFSFDSSQQLMCCEHGSDLSQEQVFALQLPIAQFPSAKQALDSLQCVVEDNNAIPPPLAARLRPIVGEDRFVVLPVWVVGHVLGFLVFAGVKLQPDKIAGPLTVAELGKSAASLLAVLGFRLEQFGDEDEPTRVGIIQRYAAMGQMAAEIGHDIQASLYGMKNYAYLLSKGVQDPRKLTYTRAISEGIAYIEKLSSEMRKLTGEPREVALSPTDLCKVIDSAVLLMNPLAVESNIAIVKEFAEGIPMLRADPVALTEVFLNLGLNAIHSMSQGGEIRITVKPKGDRVAITFQDNGSGITEEILSKFWNNSSYAARSFTNKGLYIVQRIIRQLRGSVEIDTKPGVGTAFFIELWVNPELSAPNATPETRSAPNHVAAPVKVAQPAGTRKTALT